MPACRRLSDNGRDKPIDSGGPTRLIRVLSSSVFMLASRSSRRELVSGGGLCVSWRTIPRLGSGSVLTPSTTPFSLDFDGFEKLEKTITKEWEQWQSERPARGVSSWMTFLIAGAYESGQRRCSRITDREYCMSRSSSLNSRPASLLSRPIEGTLPTGTIEESSRSSHRILPRGFDWRCRRVGDRRSPVFSFRCM
jgi:hypothetical protein